MKTYSYQQGSIEERVIQVAHYIIEHNATVRQAAGAFACQQKYGTQRFDTWLLHINPSLAAQARKILDVNKQERHIRGGMATRDKYMHKHMV